MKDGPDSGSQFDLNIDAYDQEAAYSDKDLSNSIAEDHGAAEVHSAESEYEQNAGYEGNPDHLIETGAVDIPGGENHDAPPASDAYFGQDEAFEFINTDSALSDDLQQQIEAEAGITSDEVIEQHNIDDIEKKFDEFDNQLNDSQGPEAPNEQSGLDDSPVQASEPVHEPGAPVNGHPQREADSDQMQNSFPAPQVPFNFAGLIAYQAAQLIGAPFSAGYKMLKNRKPSPDPSAEIQASTWKKNRAELSTADFNEAFANRNTAFDRLKDTEWFNKSCQLKDAKMRGDQAEVEKLTPLVAAAENTQVTKNAVSDFLHYDRDAADKAMKMDADSKASGDPGLLEAAGMGIKNLKEKSNSDKESLNKLDPSETAKQIAENIKALFEKLASKLKSGPSM